MGSRIYDAYDLAPPPPPTVFTLHHSPSTRARFPDFEDPLYRNFDGSVPDTPAAALRDFMKALYDINFSNEMLVQTRWLGGLLCILIAIAGAIILLRLYQGSFWLVRIVRSPRGSLVVPNSLMCFSLCEGIFGSCLVACMFMWPKWYSHEDPRAPETLLCWVLYLWSPLIAGAFAAAFGVTYATPSTSDRSTSKGKRQLPARVSPIVINFLSLGSPFLVLFAVTGAAIPATVNYVRSQRDFRQWQLAYASDMRLTHTMLQSAQDIWSHQLRGVFYSCIGFCLWTISALTVTAFYGYAGGNLIFTIRRQIHALRDSRTSERPSADDGGFPPKLTISQEDDVEAVSDSSKPNDRLPPATFFPPVKPSAMRTIRSVSNRTRQPKVEMQTRFLEKVYKNFLVQFLGIFLAELTFIALAIYVTVKIYDSFEFNALPVFVETAVLWAAWASVVFGASELTGRIMSDVMALTWPFAAFTNSAVTLIAIAMRVYEPVAESFSAIREGDERKDVRDSIAGRSLGRRLSARTVDLDAGFSQIESSSEDYAMSKRDLVRSREHLSGGSARPHRDQYSRFANSQAHHFSADSQKASCDFSSADGDWAKIAAGPSLFRNSADSDHANATVAFVRETAHCDHHGGARQVAMCTVSTPSDRSKPPYHQAEQSGMIVSENQPILSTDVADVDDRLEELGSGVTLTTPSLAFVEQSESSRNALTLRRPTSASSSLRERNMPDRPLVSALTPLRDIMRGRSIEKERSASTVRSDRSSGQLSRPPWSAPEEWGSPELADDLLQEIQATHGAQSLPPRADSALDDIHHRMFNQDGRR